MSSTESAISSAGVSIKNSSPKPLTLPSPGSHKAGLGCAVQLGGQSRRAMCADGQPKVISSKGSDRPSLARMTFPVLRRTTLKACLRAGHLGPPISAGLTESFSTRGSDVPSSCQVSLRAAALRSSKSSNVFWLLGSNMLSGWR